MSTQNNNNPKPSIKLKLYGEIVNIFKTHEELEKKVYKSNIDDYTKHNIVHLIDWHKENDVEIKGNPVPSIDLYKLAITYCAGAPDNQTKEEAKAIINFAKFINKQNGVETDNEQPKCPICNESMVGFKDEKWCQNHCKEPLDRFASDDGF